MKIVLSRLEEGARSARGVAVIVDVYRAFSCSALVLQLGAQELILMESVEEALAYRSQNPSALLMGEMNGRLIPGFDLSNSPSEILRTPPGLFAGRTVVQRTSSGVPGALLALQRAQVVFLGSYLNATATASAVKTLEPAEVHIVAMGREMKKPTAEDEWCARYLGSLLGGAPYSHLDSLREILDSWETKKFLQGDQAHYPAQDPIVCLQRDMVEMALAARWEGSTAVVRPWASGTDVEPGRSAPGKRTHGELRLGAVAGLDEGEPA